MERLSLIIKQLELAKELLKEGNFFSCRLALVLIDNVIEILIYRKIKWDLEFNELSNAIGRHPWIKNYKNKPSIVELNESYRHFPKKVKYLMKKTLKNDPSKGKLILLAHNYRNEAFHREEFKFETIFPISLTLFELACDLLVSLPELYYEISIDNKSQLWKEFTKKYSLKTDSKLNKKNLEKIISKLKKNVIVDVLEYRSYMMIFLKFRLESVTSKILNIKDDIKKLDKDLKKFNLDKKLSENLVYILKINCQKVLQKRVKKFNSLNNCKRKYELLFSFMEMDKEFSKFENNVFNAYRETDAIKYLIKELNTNH